MIWQDGPVTVHIGDALAVLRELPADSAHCVVTSPPYWGLRDYGIPGQLGLEATPEEYIAAMVEVFREVRRVLRPDGTLWLNLGDSYWNGGGEKRDGGHGFVDGGKPKLEAARGSLLQARSSTAMGLKPKDLVGIPWRLAFALQADGWWLRSDIVWAKPNPMPESVTDRPIKAHEYVFLLTKQSRYFYDAEAVREAQSAESLARYAYGFNKVGKGIFENGASHSKGNGADGGSITANPAGRNLRSVWTIATQPYPEAHFATFPEELARRCIAAGTAEDGTVLDPFAGSGTTLAVARRMGRRAVGIELQPSYLPLIQRRVLEAALPLLELIT